MPRELGQLWSNYGPRGYADILTEATFDVQFFAGQKMGSRFPQTVIRVNPVPKPPDFFTVGSLDIVSARLKAFFQKENLNIEFLPLRMQVGAEDIADSFFFANPLDVFPCLDRENSKFSEYDESEGGGIMRIDHLVLQDDLTSGSKYFVMEERLLLIAEKELFQKMIREGFVGFDFKDLLAGPF